MEYPRTTHIQYERDSDGQTATFEIIRNCKNLSGGTVLLARYVLNDVNWLESGMLYSFSPRFVGHDFEDINSLLMPEGSSLSQKMIAPVNLVKLKPHCINADFIQNDDWEQVSIGIITELPDLT